MSKMNGSQELAEPFLVITVTYDPVTGRFDSDCSGNFVIPEPLTPILNHFMSGFAKLLLSYRPGMIRLADEKLRQRRR